MENSAQTGVEDWCNGGSGGDLGRGGEETSAADEAFFFDMTSVHSDMLVQRCRLLERRDRARWYAGIVFSGQAPKKSIFSLL